MPTWPALQKNLELEAEAAIRGSNDSSAIRRKALLTASRSAPSAWKAFEHLEESFGTASFQSAITRQLQNALRCDIPLGYTQLWNLGVRGILTLNIDRLAQRAFLKSSAQANSLTERSGLELRELLGTLTDPHRRFIANLHGHLEDPINWVFTEKKLTALLKNDDYNEFVRDCIKYCMIVLIGVTATDRAVLEHFRRARADHINIGPHFWLTASDDFDAIAAAESSGIQVIEYPNADGKHAALQDIFKDLKQYVPAAEPAEPVAWDPRPRDSQPLDELPEPAALMAKSPNELRALLNSHAQVILSTKTEATDTRFADFCKKYSRPILLASSFEPEQSDANSVLGYLISDFRKEGGFGKVWHGHDDMGTEVAVKAFRYEIREKPELLDAFRRGVRSMQYLEQRGVKGIVRFLAASEIPPVVVMEWIEGATLHEAIQQGGLSDWNSRISILHRLAEIIYAAHNAPERILHRDLRPQNVMIRDYYSDGITGEVVVLDFDLSWHVGAMEKSVYVAGGTAYLAPEQLNAQPHSTTRSAAVDSFGFGMTAYFSLSKNDPVINMNLRADWDGTLHSLAVQNKCKDWRSLPNRFHRMITASTELKQADRLSFAEIVSEMAAMRQALEAPDTITDIQSLAEELFARSEVLSDYSLVNGWPHRDQGTGLTVVSSSAPTRNAIRLKIRFAQQGNEKYRDLVSAVHDLKSMPSPISAALFERQEIAAENRDFVATLDLLTFDPTLLLGKAPFEIDTLLDRVIARLNR